MRMGTIFALYGVLVIAAAACTTAVPEDPTPLDPALQSELAVWLEAEGDTPESYVVGLFSDHDVVFLGEQHRIKHDVLFVQSLVEPLYDAGVRVLAYEFARREDQPLIDSLLALKEWDGDLAREIVFRHSATWGFREYVGVFEAAWKHNSSLPAGAPPFRILGLNDSPDWSHLKTKQDRNSGEVMKKVWRGGGEDHWAGVILDAVRSGEKVLVYCGIHHAFTRYRQPIVLGGEFVRFDNNLRCGNHVYNTIGDMAVTVFLHAPWSGDEGYGDRSQHPADGIIDALMLAAGPRPVGFGLERSLLGEQCIQDAVYRHGYDDFRLKDFCDGWIYMKPISEYEGVTAIPGWVHEDNLEHARAQSPNPDFRKASIEKFNSRIARDTEIRRHWEHLR